MELDVPRCVLTEAGEQQHELVEGEVSKAIRRENFANSLSERILLELRALDKLAVRQLHVHQLIMNIWICCKNKYIEH